MRLTVFLSILGAAIVLPLGAQTPSGAAEGTPMTVAGVSAIAVNRPGRVTTAVKLRETPSTSAAVIEYWSTTTQREPEQFLPVGVTVLVAARTVEKEKIGEWTNYWYRIEFTTAKQGTVQAWAYGEFIQLEVGRPPGNMVLVEGGTFQMGEGESGGWRMHPVTLSNFSIGKYEVTQKEWVAVMGSNPSRFKGDTLPVETVTWFDAVDFCNRLSAKEGLQPCYSISGTSVTCDFSKNGYRLPTEAEWEYAAKGGRLSRGYRYAGGDDAYAVAWHENPSGHSTEPVGGKQPNELGLYDMSGNVFEWCWDWMGDYGSAAQRDPKGPPSGSDRALRGGDWATRPVYGLASAYRSTRKPQDSNEFIGFRVVRRAGP